MRRRFRKFLKRVNHSKRWEALARKVDAAYLTECRFAYPVCVFGGLRGLLFSIELNGYTRATDEARSKGVRIDFWARRAVRVYRFKHLKEMA